MNKYNLGLFGTNGNTPVYWVNLAQAVKGTNINSKISVQMEIHQYIR